MKNRLQGTGRSRNPVRTQNPPPPAPQESSRCQKAKWGYWGGGGEWRSSFLQAASFCASELLCDLDQVTNPNPKGTGQRHVPVWIRYIEASMDHLRAQR